MLTIDYEKRITTGDALLHPWICRREQVSGKRHLDETIVHLKKFNARRKFKVSADLDSLLALSINQGA